MGGTVPKIYEWGGGREAFARCWIGSMTSWKPAYRPIPEFRAAIMAYAEWGTRLAAQNSQPGAQPPAHAPVPRWGWGVAPPYQPGDGAES